MTADFITTRARSGALAAALEARFGARRDPPARERRAYLDTFDGRLFRQGLRLCLAATAGGGGPWVELEAAGGGIGARARASAAPAFAWDLPQGAIRDRVAPIIEVRRLLPLVTVTIERVRLRVRNADEKTVAWVDVEHAAARVPASAGPAKPLGSVLRVAPVKGYRAAAQRLEAFLEADLGLARATGDRYRDALDAVGRVPGEQAVELRVAFDPDTSAETAARCIHRNLLEAMLANEPGMRDDLDMEFIHDFRVAVRRTRSALAQLKAVFPDAPTRHFTAEFKWLGGVTGPVRDLDVYLEKMNDYRGELPPEVQSDLAPLQDYLHRCRRAERRRLLGALDSERYRGLVRDWRRLLDAPAAAEGAGANAHLPIGRLAAERITSVHRRVRRDGRRIHAETPAAVLHRLRIDCKKLRYLLEFFRCLYPPADLLRLVKALKQLQDVLGEFNDLDVQQATLRRFADEMAREMPVTPACLLAMGRLVERLLVRQDRVRARCERRFARFDTPNNRARFRALGHGANGGA